MVPDRSNARLRMLGSGDSITAVTDAEGWDRQDFDAWWSTELERRLPDVDRALSSEVVSGPVEILRDHRGIPHVFAATDHDLFVGYGFAQAQDRLFQSDMQRRKGHGTLAALIGPEGVEHDRVAHTIGFPETVERHAEALDAPTMALLEAFAQGVNAAARLMTADEALPIEYGLLGAAWEPWSAADCLAAALAWRWQFTGRPHVIAGPELLKRHLGDDRLVVAILSATREADTPILPPDTPYPPREPGVAPGATTRHADIEPRASDAPGSNDWVIAGTRTRSGLPLLGSDPHMPYQIWSAFHEVGLHGGSFDAVGAGLVGMPGLLFGRNRHITWGITNNICSLRDLYQERSVDGATDTFEHDGQSVPAGVRTVSIAVRDGPPVHLRVVRTGNGPLVDDLLPALARGTGPVSMRWLGTEVCDWTAALLRLDRADTVRAAMQACEGWMVPTFNLVLGDTHGDIGYLATGRIPIRTAPERGYRPGWDPAHRWVGTIPHAGMPRAISPAQGYLSSANNRPAPDDYPYPLSGTWDEGYRQRRIAQLIEAGGANGETLDRPDLGRMHSDVRSLRAAATLTDLLGLMDAVADGGTRPMLDLLRGWDLESTTHSAGAAIYQVLSFRWAQAVMAARVTDLPTADYLAAWGLGLASRLLRADDLGWFAPGGREAAARTALREAHHELTATLGPDPAAWTWGAIHRLALRHPLSGRGDLSILLDKPAVPVPGDLVTLDNSGFDAGRHGSGWMATSGAGYRLEVDLGEDPPSAWTITGESQSGAIGSPHHDDQRDDFVAGHTRRLPLDRADVERSTMHRMRLDPSGGPR